ncbi:uncharacterized protein LOC131686804 [Topomyia yanbarensis]|uniref:uncharacterized protein LOC131686804 n=1 Tax=Topomyia yanbarensis TaxID=2498891 RepID=UPI00273AE139|nr:uncharacterized protein LOC131686804 [Topomyia yanbarensis]
MAITFTSAALILCIFYSVTGWDLAPIGITEFSIKHVTLYKSRAFLTIDSFNVSLVETSWPENKVGGIRPRVLSDDSHELVDSCEGLKYVIGTDVDRVARLWILDRGDSSAACNPKILIRSLIITTTKEISYDLRTPNREFHSIVVDPIQASDGDTRAFITLINTDYLLMFSLFKREVGKFTFEKRDLSPLSPISLSEVAINQNQLYISDGLSGRLFSLPVKTIRQFSFPEYGVQKMILKTNVTYLGRLLGRASGLKLDLRDNLYYIIARDGAIVKCKPEQSVRAEDHLVILQRDIDVSQIILGTTGKGWVVASHCISNESKRHCLRINT